MPGILVPVRILRLRLFTGNRNPCGLDKKDKAQHSILARSLVASVALGRMMQVSVWPVGGQVLERL